MQNGRHKIYLSGLFLYVFCTCPFNIHAENIQLQIDQITGDEELPKVTYIIPWKDEAKSEKTINIELYNYYEQLLKPYFTADVIK